MKLEKETSALYDLSKQIKDPQIKEIFDGLFNIIEELSTHNNTLEKDNQKLRDEINRLKGEQGKPNIKPNTRLLEQFLPFSEFYLSWYSEKNPSPMSNCIHFSYISLQISNKLLVSDETIIINLLIH